ncbi:PilN domain-containing protein [Spirulina sp. CS-785/01]|uniref:PilN domain-containing protein n=1 Tax=Spirulina sp. CS-785/01 TaxID=3021716 RepID=UPI00232F3A15|nr:PilN domain-containing protein [Spirulina sp. CS-785/01]MDB9313268.1 PilN domain-containing protein [Spirulina sp. CS-785/01]
MYSLDINFLNDRAAIAAPASEEAFEKKPKRQISLAEWLPAIGGGVVAVVLAAGAGGYWLYVQWQQGQLQAELNRLEGDIQQLQAQNQQIQQLQTQVDIAKQQTAGLTTVFTRILPWSAVLADLRDRIPANLQITSISEQAPEDQDQQPAQNGEGEAAPAPSLPRPSLNIQGYANSYSEVNSFLVTLQRSPFFDAANSRILEASLVSDPNPPEPLESPGEQQTNQTTEDIQLPEVVEYTLEVGLNDLSDLPATELVNQLQNKGTLGSVIRIQTLKNKGLLEVSAPENNTQQQNNTQQTSN